MSAIVADHLTVEEFYNVCIVGNCPAVLTCEATKTWRAVKEWTSIDNAINVQALQEQFGHHIVPITHCTAAPLAACLPSECRLDAFLRYLKSGDCSELLADSKAVSVSWPIYLKDWHFTLDTGDADMYTVPAAMSSDWLNAFCAHEGNTDFRFVYLGPQGSCTFMHTDVLNSFSWSTNISGRKRWVLFAPSQAPLLHDANGHLVADIDTVDAARFPSFSTAESLEVFQNAGETVFVPSRWFHQVYNEESTLSINHNWVNAANVGFMLDAILDDFAQTKREIHDCIDMENWADHCQLILKANCGFDFLRFLNFLVYVVDHEIRPALSRRPLLHHVRFTDPQRLVEFELAQVRLTFTRLVAAWPAGLSTELSTKLHLTARALEATLKACNA